MLFPVVCHQSPGLGQEKFGIKNKEKKSNRHDEKSPTEKRAGKSVKYRSSRAGFTGKT